MKPIRTWIVIADGTRARILLNEGPGKGVSFVPGTDFRHDVPPNRDIYSDRQGRVFESATSAHSAIERPDAHAAEKEKFAQSIVAFLKEKCQAKEFDRWILVAAPETLSDFRKHLDHSLKTSLAGELAKDLTKIPNDKVRDHLQDLLPV